MKSPDILMVYSSRKTGNSKKLAEGICLKLDAPVLLSSVENAPPPTGYKYIILGFGIYHGWPDDDMRSYMKKCQNSPIGLFMTLGAWPDSPHAAIAIGRAEGILESCKVTAKYICHGRLDADLIARLKKLPPDSAHAMTEARKERIAAAAQHPNATDISTAANLFNNEYKKLIIT